MEAEGDPLSPTWANRLPIVEAIDVLLPKKVTRCQMSGAVFSRGSSTGLEQDSTLSKGK